MNGRVAITGARGWLGSCVARHFEAEGWETIGLVRAPAGEGERRFVLGENPGPEILAGVDALIHCAWDFHPRTWLEIERVNVGGSELLFRAAAAAGVKRLVFISTMSAFPTCHSLYGEGKLAVEKSAAGYGALLVRPGLITGEGAGGMMGSLERQLRHARLVPVLAGDALLYTVHERDLCAFLFRFCAGRQSAPRQPVIAAHPQPWPFRKLLRELARRMNARPRFVPLPWQPAWIALRAAEALGLRLAFRSDSLLSLAHQDPRPDFASAAAVGFTARPFTADDAP